MSSGVTEALTRNLCERPPSGGATILVMPTRGRPRSAPLPPVNNRVREIREAKGWSIARLSKETRPRVAAATIQRHETGEAQVDLHQLEIYAIALGVKPEELLVQGMRIDDQDRELLGLFHRMNTLERQQLIKVAAALQAPEPVRKAS